MNPLPGQQATGACAPLQGLCSFPARMQLGAAGGQGLLTLQLTAAVKGGRHSVPVGQGPGHEFCLTCRSCLFAVEMVFFNSLGFTQVETHARAQTPSSREVGESLSKSQHAPQLMIRSHDGPQSLNLRLALTTHLLLKDLARQALTGNHPAVTRNHPVKPS